ncbi:biosynthetic arginine decarboxylase [Acidihalobacter ferrooxydans]|uniref:Biosynthetic arginine decarboxylase n=1 Tax=Acidihalobacter ferrooxydans TaxID=1765967 RepID=A0A1P8UKK6_9GAMM|nr:biosynthetic arginine decarboxylase [Acidihalobacter ferrooxydans]APZ44349.1 arginine decarboxylase [Acidihalobacter ferrooxydans]
MPDWSLEDARKLYNTTVWGGGHYEICANGELHVQASNGARLSLRVLADELREQGLRLPLLVRFNHILRERVDALCGAFALAREAQEYAGGYTAIYPIKVNQQRSVVDEILRHGGARVGLEAGSKPELMAVLALSRTGGVVVCNGYKDREYLRLALLGRLLGHRIYVVIEKPAELERVIEAAQELGVRPLLGVRVRLSSIGGGKWEKTGGEKGKFGLSAAQVITVTERLREVGMLDCLQLLHFHMGSQIANIRDIQRGVREAARFYVELRRLGADLRVADVGGGLGVDYEGSRSRSDCSMNYSVNEYAANIVRTLREVCELEDAPHPEIFTESGRALTAHHAVLITQIIDVERACETTDEPPPEDDAPLIVRDMWELLQAATARSPSETFHDASYWLSEAHGMYTHGVLSLAERARVEELFVAICQRLPAALDGQGRSAREMLDGLRERLADKVFCNFSLFQSMPDAWAIDQVFPVAPLQRLDERPERHGMLQDLTCDSDGQIERYVVGSELEHTLPLHDWAPGQCYLLGIFLVGAYQEILGDLHNLFGDTDAINVDLRTDGTHALAQPELGDTVAELLGYVHFDPDELRRIYRQKVAGTLAPERADAVLAELEAGLSGYTYLED